MANVVCDPLFTQDTLLFTSTVGSLTFPSRTVDTNTVCMLVGGGAYTEYVFASAQGELYWGVHLQFSDATASSNGSFLEWYKGSTVLGHLRTNSSRKVDAYRGSSTLLASGSKVFSDNTSYHLQLKVKIDDSTGAIETRWDNVTDINFSGDTKPGSDTTIDKFYFGSFTSSHSGIYLASLVINDTTGGSEDTWPGVQRMVTKVPTSDGNYSDWTRSTGSTNFGPIDEMPYSQTDYLASTSNGQRFSVIPAAHGISSAATIKAKVIRHVANYVSSGQVKSFFRISSTDYDSATLSPGSGPTLLVDRRTLNPNTSAAWAVSDAPEVGLLSVL